MRKFTRILNESDYFWFYQYKREYKKFEILHTKYKKKFGYTTEYFIAIRPIREKLEELLSYVLKELSSNQNKGSERFESYVDELQKFLDSVYDDHDADYSQSENITLYNPALSETIPKLHNSIKTVIEGIQLVQVQQDDIVSSIKNDYLLPLKGYWYGKKIMTDSEYSRMIDYAVTTFTSGKVPSKIKKIPLGNSSCPKKFYQHTVYRLYKAYKYKGQKKTLWVDFLINVFDFFSSSPERSTIIAKFGSSYDDNLYTADLIKANQQ